MRLNREVGAAGGEALCLQRLAELALACGRPQDAPPLLIPAAIGLASAGELARAQSYGIRPRG